MIKNPFAVILSALAILFSALLYSQDCPSLVASGNLNSPASVLQNGLFYVLDKDTIKLRIYDLADPSNPLELGSLAIYQEYHTSLYAMAVSGSFAYIATYAPLSVDHYGALFIVDVSDPTTPSQTAVIALGPKGSRTIPTSVDVRNSLVYVTIFAYYYTTNLEIFDVSNPAAPALARELYLPHADPNEIHIHNDIALLACGTDGLKIYDISNPLEPQIRSSFACGNCNIVSACTEGNFAYLADRNCPAGMQCSAFMRILDISNILDPEEVAYFQPSAEETIAESIVAYQDTAYLSVSIWNAGANASITHIFAMDISDPLTPSIIGMSQGGACGITVFSVEGNLLTSSEGCSGYRIFDISCCHDPSISQHPQDRAICIGTNATFSALATGAVTYFQWQVDFGSGFEDLLDGPVSGQSPATYSGATTATLSITSATGGMNGYSYRCVFSDPCPPAAISNAATLYVNSIPTSTVNPSDQTLCPGAGASISVTTTGEDLIFQWRKNNTLISDGEHYSGTTTAILSISNITAAQAGAYDCLVTSGGCDAPSPEALLRVDYCLAPTLLEEPGFTAGTTNTIQWNAIFEAVGYICEASSDYFASVIQSSGIISQDNYQFISLSGNVNYQYRVKAHYGWGDSPWSDYVNSTQDSDLPSSQIADPISGAILHGEIWHVVGTASDSTSGIQRVELSWDDGVTWFAATGTTNWTYDWALPGDGNFTLLCRAIDHAWNIEVQHGVSVIVRNRPLPPTDIAATDVPFDGGGVVSLSWTLSGDDGAAMNYIIGYGIYRANASIGPFNQIGFVAAGVAGYEDTSAGMGIGRWYKVRALTDADVWPNYTDSVIAGPIAGLDNPPLPPNNLQADLTYACNVRIFWIESPSPDILLYNIYYDAGTGIINWSAPIGIVNAPYTTWASSGLPLSTRFIFAIRAKDLSGQEDGFTTNLISISTDCAADNSRAEITQPQPGRKIKGNNVTIKANLIQGTSQSTSHVLFQYRQAGTVSWSDMIPTGTGQNPDLSSPYVVHWNTTVHANGNYDLQAVAYNLTGVSDPQPPYITVTIANGGGANIAETNTSGDHNADLESYKGCGNSNITAFERDGNILQVNIPKGSLPQQIEILNLQDVDPAVYGGSLMIGYTKSHSNARAAIGQLTPAAIYRAVGLAGGQSAFSSGIELIFFYQDYDNDFILDNTTIPVMQLDVFREIGTGQWDLQNTNRTVDTANKFIRVTVTQTGTFGLFAFPKPKPVEYLIANKLGPDAVLTWQAVSEDEKNNLIFVDHYSVYAATAPHFNPDLINGSNRIGQAAGTAFPHSGALELTENYYYLVTAVDGLGRESYPR